MKKVSQLIAALCLLSSAWPASAIDKQPLKVLYVGGSTDVYQAAPEERDSLARLRAQSFKDMLEHYFTSVTVLIGDEYSADMSKDYDVTILDGRPKEIRPAIMERDAAGNLTRYERASYLPADFDRATVTIGQIGEIVGRSIGSKNDWYCLCLDAQAHHWVDSHPIFQGPFPVKMTVETCPTPSDAFHYTYYYDGTMPDSIPMWRVQTKGYKDTPGFAIGMVSRPWGYTDSPDAEYISSGVCAKTLDAVAIGRHGNFLHWGFAASPAYMTDEAKNVFANAVAYIARFNGRGMQARKFNDRIATREYLKEVAYLVTKASYEERMASDSIWTEERRKEYAEITAKQKAGEELNSTEKETLKYGEPAKFVRRSREEYVKRYAKHFYDLFGTDEEAYAKFFKDNYEYFYSEGFYNIFVDEDVKAWGIPNHDHRLLDKAISSLEEEKDTDRARRILSRYTMADFATADEWRNWYETYKDRMYFTEAGGWKFLVDGDTSIPGNDYFEYQKRVESHRTASTGSETSDANPVMVSVNVAKTVSDEKQLVVRFKIHPGYHIYANVAGDDPYIPTAISLSLPDGVTAGEWKASQPGPFGDTGTTAYEGEAEYTCPLDGNGAGTITCTVSYQCCDAHICMPPAKKELKVTI